MSRTLSRVGLLAATKPCVMMDTPTEYLLTGGKKGRPPRYSGVALFISATLGNEPGSITSRTIALGCDYGKTQHTSQITSVIVRYGDQSEPRFSQLFLIGH